MTLSIVIEQSTLQAWERCTTSVGALRLSKLSAAPYG